MELFMEKKRTLICSECNKEFVDSKDAGEHAMKEQHYNFKLKGTNLSLIFVC